MQTNTPFVLDVLNDLSATRSRIEKHQILLNETESEERFAVLHKVFTAAYTTSINYFTKSVVGQPGSKHESAPIGLCDAIDELLEKVATREITGNNHRNEFITDLYERLHEDDAEVFKRVILHNMKCGVSCNSFNKVVTEANDGDLLWETIPVFSCLLAEKFTPERLEGLTKPYIAQLKSDGARCCALVIGGKVTYYTREGNVLHLRAPHLDATLLDIRDRLGYDAMIDGEVVMVSEGNDGELSKRQTSNGIVDKAIHDTLTEDVSSRFRYYIWDQVSIVDFEATKSPVPYHTRLDDLNAAYDPTKSIMDGDAVQISPTQLCHTYDEVMAYAESLITQDEEGAMVKSYDLIWENRRTRAMLKLKDERECDLIVTGWNYGTPDKSFHDGIGTLDCETADGNLKVSIYGGLSNQQRGYVQDQNGNWVIDPEFDFDQYTGKIVKVTYNAVLDDEGDDIYSLFCPRIDGFRTDKTEANTTDYVLNRKK